MLQISKLTNLGIEFSFNCEETACITKLEESSSANTKEGEVLFEYCFKDNLILRAKLERVDDGLWKRTDTLTNCGDKPMEIAQPAAGFTFGGEASQVKITRSKWCNEGQFETPSMNDLPLKIGSQGRTCSGYTPHFEIESRGGLWIMDLLPCGDWSAYISKKDEKVSLKYEHFDADTISSLAPGESIEFGIESMLRCTTEAEVKLSNVQVQNYSLRLPARLHTRVLPVIYNTWFDRFTRISIESMSLQLQAAKEVGCEVFVIDAGWYGKDGNEWWTGAGDWSECPQVFSETSLREFSDKVRASGLDFGIWMEPERIGVNAPVRAAHPDWFISAYENAPAYPDFLRPEACDWVLSEMTRVVGTYDVKWLKVDNNFDFSPDPHHAGHKERVSRWYGIVDELSRRFPDLVIEGCAGGGIRNDLLALSHFDANFLSDTVDPIDIIRIGMSCLSWMAPGKATKWPVIYPTNNAWTRYAHEAFNTSDVVLCPLDATSEFVSSYHLNFAVRASMPGTMGFSGNIAGLPPELKRELAEHIAFYKKHRQFIQSAVGIPLTPIEPITMRRGFAAMQLASPDFGENMIFVYNIDAPRAPRDLKINPVGLKRGVNYSLLDEKSEVIADSLPGEQIMTDGLEVECQGGHARALVLKQAQES